LRVRNIIAKYYLEWCTQTEAKRLSFLSSFIAITASSLLLNDLIAILCLPDLSASTLAPSKPSALYLATALAAGPASTKLAAIIWYGPDDFITSAVVTTSGEARTSSV